MEKCVCVGIKSECVYGKDEKGRASFTDGEEGSGSFTGNGGGAELTFEER